MTYERRNQITDLVLEFFKQRNIRYGNPKTHPVPYSAMALALQAGTDITVEEIDHVIVQLCCRLVINLIGGDLFYTALIKPEAVRDHETFDWLYATGRYSQE